MKKIQTTRFGDVEVSDEQLITFRDGMIGFSALKKYVLIESPSMPLILWLQSMDKPEIAFPVMEPYFFKRDFKSDFSEADKCSIAYEEKDRLKVFSVLTIPENAEAMTVNLKAPVVININKAMATQVILQEKSLEVRMPAHEAFSRALASLPIANGFTAESADSIEQVEEESWNAVNVRTRHSIIEDTL
jgi:flagellar assembly factor FliW